MLLHTVGASKVLQQRPAVQCLLHTMTSPPSFLRTSSDNALPRQSCSAGGVQTVHSITGGSQVVGPNGRPCPCSGGSWWRSTVPVLNILAHHLLELNLALFDAAGGAGGTGAARAGGRCWPTLDRHLSKLPTCASQHVQQCAYMCLDLLHSIAGVVLCITQRRSARFWAQQSSLKGSTPAESGGGVGQEHAHGCGGERDAGALPRHAAGGGGGAVAGDVAARPDPRAAGARHPGDPVLHMLPEARGLA